MTTYYQMSEDILSKTESIVEGLIKVHKANEDTDDSQFIQTVQLLAHSVVKYGNYDLLNELLKTALRFKGNPFVEPLIKAGADVQEIAPYLIKRKIKQQDENFLDLLINQAWDKNINYRQSPIDFTQYLPEEFLKLKEVVSDTNNTDDLVKIDYKKLTATPEHLTQERNAQAVPPMLTALMKANNFFEFKELADSGVNYHANGEHLFLQACVLKNSKFAQYLMPRDKEASGIINQGLLLARQAANTDFLSYVENWQKSLGKTKAKKYTNQNQKTDSKLEQILQALPDTPFYQKLSSYIQEVSVASHNSDVADNIAQMVEHYASHPAYFYNAFKKESQGLSEAKKIEYINEMFDYALAHNHHPIVDTLLAIDTTGHIDLSRDDIWQNTVDNQQYYRLTHLMGKTNLKTKDLTQYGFIASTETTDDGIHQEFFKNALPQIGNMMKSVSYYHQRISRFFENNEYYHNPDQLWRNRNSDARIGVLPKDMKQAYENDDYEAFNNLIERYWDDHSMNYYDHKRLHEQLALISDRKVLSMFVAHNESQHFQNYASQIQIEHVARQALEEQKALKKQQKEAHEQAQLEAQFAADNVLVSTKDKEPAPVANVFESRSFNLGIAATSLNNSNNTRNSTKSARTQKICTLGQTAVLSEHAKENRIRTIINQSGKEILVKDLQNQWDKSLIEAFFKPSEKTYMSSFMTRFLKSNEISLNDLLDQKFKKLPNPGKFSGIMHPHRFVCAYLPELADKLFTFDKAPSDTEIMKLVSDFSKHNTASSRSSGKSFLTPEEREELRKTQQEFNVNKIYTNSWQDKRSASNRSNWSAVKGKMR